MFVLKTSYNLSTTKGNIESLTAKESQLGLKKKTHHFEKDENPRDRLMLCLL